MSHEISIRAGGFAETAFVGQAGWTGLGQKLNEGASIEEWQVAAGMDWKIQRSKVRFATRRDETSETFAEFAGNHVLMRSDTKAPLSIVSDRFKIVQPKAVLEFFRDLVGDAGFTLDTAGVLFGGRKFWALANIGEEANVGAGDKIKGRLLVCTSCDGSMATEAKFVSERVVCNNTLQMARGEKGSTSRTTHRSVFNASATKLDLGIGAKEVFADFIANMRRLADTQLSEGEVVAMTVELFSPGAAKKAREEFVKAVNSAPVKAVTELVLNGLAKGSHFDGVKGSAYGWLNGVTEYVDHAARARSSDNRTNSAWFGKGDDLKSKAFEMALSA